MAWVGILLCLGVISSQGQPSGEDNKGEATSKDADKDTSKGEVTSGGSRGTDKGEASAVDTDVADKGSTLLDIDSKLNFTIKYNASSSWSDKNNAEKAMLWAEGYSSKPDWCKPYCQPYWCSKKGDEAPLFWWISFEKPVQIVEIKFEETFMLASFEFFGSDTCGEKGTTLKTGRWWDFIDKSLENKRAYRCYGLKVTKLAEHTDSYGPLATIKKFQFRVQGLPEIFLGGDTTGMRGIFSAKPYENFLLIEKETTWVKANEWCQRLGKNWNLAKLPTKFEEMVTRLQKLRSGSCHDSWIGLSRDSKLGANFRLVSKWYGTSGPGDVLDSDDERWAAGEPKVNDPAAAWNDQWNVGFIRVEGSQGKLHTAKYSSTKICSFFCEK